MLPLERNTGSNLCSHHAPKGRLQLLLPGSTGSKKRGRSGFDVMDKPVFCGIHPSFQWASFIQMSTYSKSSGWRNRSTWHARLIYMCKLEGYITYSKVIKWSVRRWPLTMHADVVSIKIKALPFALFLSVKVLYLDGTTCPAVCWPQL